MTDLIYRGITHTGIEAKAARTAATLIYRGVSHDGLGTETPQSAKTARMCYRGVAYGVQAAGSAPTGSKVTAGLVAA